MGMVCELCDSSEFAKIDGMFVCQNCGCKYSVEEAKALLNKSDSVVQSDTNKSNNKVESMILSCIQAYKDGRYQKVLEVTDKIMDEDADNEVAVIYNGLSIFQLYTKSPDDIKQGETMLKRGLKLIVDSNGNEELFYTCMNDLTNLFKDLSINYLNEFKKHATEFDKWTESWCKQERELGGLMLIGGCSTAHRLSEEREIEEKKKTAAKYEELYKQVQGSAMKLAAAFDRVLIEANKLINEKEYFSTDIYEKLLSISWDFWGGTPENNDIIVKHFNDLKQNCQKMKRNYEDSVLKAEKEKRLKEYWEEHRDEKEKLENEVSDLEAKASDIQAQIDEIVKVNQPELDRLYEERDQDVPAQVEYKKIKSEINDLKKQQSALGIFKGKEKKALQEQIDSKQVDLDKLYKLIETQQNERNREINGKINAIKSIGSDKRIELNNIQNRISNIKNELVKDR